MPLNLRHSFMDILYKFFYYGLILDIDQKFRVTCVIRKKVIIVTKTKIDVEEIFIRCILSIQLRIIFIALKYLHEKRRNGVFKIFRYFSVI